MAEGIPRSIVRNAVDEEVTHQVKSAMLAADKLTLQSKFPDKKRSVKFLSHSNVR